MRRAGLLAAVLLAFLLPAWDQLSPQPPVGRFRPPAPTAAEESGGDGPLESALRYPPAAVRRPKHRRPARTTPLRTPPRAPRPLEARTLAPVGASPEGPTRGQRVEQDAGTPSAGSVLGDEGQPAAGPSVPPQAELAPPPVLTPPVLAAGALRHPDGYELILSRGALTARLQPEAVEGRVILRILVLADGSVSRVEVGESSGHPALDDASVHAAWSWTFLPATRGGLPIDAWAVIPLRFVIR